MIISNDLEKKILTVWKWFLKRKVCLGAKYANVAKFQVKYKNYVKMCQIICFLSPSHFLSIPSLFLPFPFALYFYSSSPYFLLPNFNVYSYFFLSLRKNEIWRVSFFFVDINFSIIKNFFKQIYFINNIKVYFNCPWF